MSFAELVIRLLCLFGFSIGFPLAMFKIFAARPFEEKSSETLKKQDKQNVPWYLTERYNILFECLRCKKHSRFWQHEIKEAEDENKQYIL